MPASARAAAAAVVCSSESSSSMPYPRSSSASADARARRVVRDESQPVPAPAQLRDRLGGARIGSPETWSTPSTSSRMAAMAARVYSRHPLGEHPAERDRAAVLALERARAASTRSARRRASRRSSTSRPRQSLTEAQKRRVVARAGPVLRAVAQDERSQWRNRELAVERLVESLARGAARRAPAAPDGPDARAPESAGWPGSAGASRRSGCAGRRRKGCVRTAGPRRSGSLVCLRA